MFMLDRALQPLCFIFDDGFSTFMLDLPTWLGYLYFALLSFFFFFIVFFFFVYLFVCSYSFQKKAGETDVCCVGE